MESTCFIPSDEDVAIDETVPLGFWVQRENYAGVSRLLCGLSHICKHL